VSSNSSAADAPARRLLRAALDTLGREAPAHHDLLCGTLAALPVDLDIDRDAFSVRVADGALSVAAPTDPPRVTLRTDLATAHALLDAQLTVLDAVRRGWLDVRGRAGDLAVAAEALSMFLHGLVRCPSGGALLRDLRAQASKER
jgi:hypothetical protein